MFVKRKAPRRASTFTHPLFIKQGPTFHFSRATVARGAELQHCIHPLMGNALYALMVVVAYGLDSVRYDQLLSWLEPHRQYHKKACSDAGG